MNKPLEIENFTILRKLDRIEINKNRTIFGPNVISTLRFRSKCDLFAKLDDLKSAIRSWKSMHKILSAKVIKHDESFYFAIDENSSVNRNLENVRFLRAQNLHNGSVASINKEFIYQLVFEKELSEVINFEKPHDFLWRLCFVELEQSNQKERQEFVYEIFLYIHHSIVDGLSAKENMILLLSLIKKKIKGDQIEPKDFGVYPGTVDIFQREISSLDPNRPYRDLVTKPDFVDPAQAKLHSMEILNGLLEKSQINVEDYELVDLKNGQNYGTLSELVRISREVGTQKPKRFKIPEDQFLKLKKRY